MSSGRRMETTIFFNKKSALQTEGVEFGYVPGMDGLMKDTFWLALWEV